MNDSNGGSVLYIPTDPKDIERISGVIRDMSDVKTKMEAMAEYLKDAKKALKEDFDMPLSVINTLFKLYHAQKANTYFEEQSEIEALYESLFDKEND